jgi:hypothetical protein
MISTFKLKDKEFHFNLASPIFAEKLETAIDNFSKEQKESENLKDRKYSEVIKESCAICARFIDTLFGDGTSKELFPEEDLIEMEAALFSFKDFVEKERIKILAARAENFKKYMPVLN